MLSGEMTPAELCKKTSKELAPLELAEWRKQRAEKYFSENVVCPNLPIKSIYTYFLFPFWVYCR